MSGSFKTLIKIVIPVVVLFLLFRAGSIYGWTALVVAFLAVLIWNRTSWYTMLGTASYSKGEMEKALKWLGKAYSTGRAVPKSAISYAYILLKGGDVSKSHDILQRLLERKPKKDDEMLAKANMALVLWKQGKLDEAVAMLEEVIVEYKNSAIYGSLGYLTILKGDLDRALEINQEAMEYNSSNAIIQDNMGQTYHMRGEDEKALEVYEKLISTNPSFPEAYYNYAMVLLKKGDPAAALEMLEKALGFKFTFLSAISRQDVEDAIGKLKAEGLS